MSQMLSFIQCKCPASQRSTYLVLYVALLLPSQVSGVQENKTPVLRNSSIAGIVANRVSADKAKCAGLLKAEHICLECI